MDIQIVSLIVGILLGIPGAWWAWREFFYMPQKARQEVLDRLREPAPRGLIWEENRERPFKEKADEIARNGMDAIDLRARFALPDRRLWKAVRHLYGENKIDVFLLKATTVGGEHPEVPPGSSAVLPIFVRGPLPPDMRPKRSEVETILDNLR